MTSASVKRMPITPGQRNKIDIVNKDLHKGKPFEALLTKKSKTGGRNNQGRITCRHIGGGHRQKYRMVDFKRDKDGIVAKVERLEYDPNRSAHLALLLYADGERRYIIAPQNLRQGDNVQSGPESPIKPGNCLKLTNIPVGSVVHCVEMQPGRGAQIARTAGNMVQLIAKEGIYATIRLRSGETRRVMSECKAVIGEVSNPEHSLLRLGKAGATRHRGVRPTVRGTAMNPIDHPHGGGEGKTKGGRHPVSPWGQPTKGYKTRRNKRTQKFIVSRGN